MGKRPVSPRGAGLKGITALAGAILLFSMLLFLPQPAQSQAGTGAAPDVKTVEAVGVASVTGGNSALARDSAIADALRKAVEQAVGTVVSSETMVENYQTLSDNIYTRTQGYIAGYSITGESEAQGFYQVRVRAEVAVGTLKDDLNAMGLLQKKVEKPRVLFLIAEKNIGRKHYVFWWWGRSEYMGETIDISAAESSLKEFFLKKGFNVADISGSAGAFEVSDAFKVADLTSDGARSIGKGLNADIVVYGKAVATAGPRIPGSAVGSYLADITATAVRVDDGVVLASSSGHGTARNISEIAGGSEALSKASAELGNRLVEQIIARWSGPQTVTVRLTGVSDYKELTEFKNRLKGRIRGIEAVFQRSFAGGVAVLELESKVSAQKIADDISRLGPSFRVTNTTQNSIDVFVEGAELNR